MEFNWAAFISFLVMNLTALVIFKFGKRGRINAWYSGFILSMSLGQLAAAIDPIPFYGIEDSIIIKELIARFLSALSFWFSPYFVLLIGFELFNKSSPFQERIWRLLLLIPIAVGFLINFIDPQNGFLYTYLDFSKNFYIVSIWGCVCAVSSNIIIIHSIFKEKRSKIKRQKAFIAVTTIPSIFITYYVYILPLKGPYQFVSLVSGFGIFITIMLIVFAIKYGIMGLKINIEKDVFENTMRMATFGTNILNHAIKNKLGNVQLAINRLEKVLKNLEEISIIKNSLYDLNILMERIAKYSKEITLQIDIYNLSAITDSVIDLLKTSINDSNIKITKCYAIEPEVSCDIVYLKEALINIVNNAIEAIKERKKNNGEIKISITKKNRFINLAIEDNGVGISKEVQTNIFRPFFSTKKAGNHFGLGLAYVYHIMELHKIQISVRSVEGVGTTITMSFPIKKKRMSLNKLSM